MLRHLTPLVLAALVVTVLPLNTTPAAEKKMPQHVITVLYPNSPGVSFDFDYYSKHHKTMIEKLYGRGIKRYEVRRGLATPDNKAPPYIAVISITIGSQKLFDEAAAKYSQRLVDDMKNFTNGVPVIQTDEVVE
jgi:uncharacterized protein (TIGR02118 family)